jgi:hypothetical protein
MLPMKGRPFYFVLKMEESDSEFRKLTLVAADTNRPEEADWVALTGGD